MKAKLLQIRNPRRGSVLIVVIIFTAMLAVVMPSYLALSNSSLRMANRSFYGNAARGLAESGIEHAIWALNQVAEGNDPWGAWQIVGDDARATFGGFGYGGNVAGSVTVRLIGYESENPTAVADAVVSLHDGSLVHRYMRADLSASPAEAGGGIFAYGMLARDYIRAEGGASFDSWNSDPAANGSFVPYSAAVRKDNVKIASASAATPSIWLGSSDVYGSVAVGGATASALHMSWGGQVGPRDQNQFHPDDTFQLWAKNPPGWLVSQKNHGALTTGFTATFEEVTAPEATIFNNAFLSPTYGESSIGANGATQIISLSRILVTGSHTLTIKGDVTLILPPSNTNVLKIEGSGKIRLADGASLKIYTPGNIDISGAGFLNSQAPSNLQIWSTAALPGQTIALAGSGNLSGAIYAPNAHFTIPGGTNIYGAVVGKSFNMTGSGAFHYDESLINLGMGTAGNGAGAGGRVTVVRVAAMTAAEYESAGSQ